MKYVTVVLTQGFSAMVDKEDAERVARHSWVIQERKDYKKVIRYYARATIKYKQVYLHRFILELVDPKMQVDHINGDGLDNRRINLRLVSNSQNQMNRIRRTTGVTRLKGVFRKSGRWYAQLTYKGKHIHIPGGHPDEVSAGKSYDREAIKYFGEFARTNFL